MKKFLTLLLVLAFAMTALIGCSGDAETPENNQPQTEGETVTPETDAEIPADETEEAPADEAEEAPADEAEEAPADEAEEVPAEEVPTEEVEDSEESDVMTYDEYVAAEIDDPVVIEAYVQGKQSWWDNKATVYTQDKDGAYFLYEMACSEEDYELLTVGTKIKVTGYKAEWAGEVEIVDATFEFVEGAEPYTAEPVDATAWLGTDELIKHQNQVVYFTGMTVEAINFKNETPGDDIYVTLSKDGQSYDFCVEYYLTNDETEVYKTVSELEAGDVVDVTGFLYWYEGVNTHITSVTVA